MLLQATGGGTLCTVSHAATLSHVLINLMAARAIHTHSDRVRDGVPNHISDRLYSVEVGGLEHGPNVYSMTQLPAYIFAISAEIRELKT